MKKIFVTIIVVILLAAIGIVVGTKVYPYIRLISETSAVLKENGTYQMDCYLKSEETSGMEYLFQIHGKKADTMISGTIGEEVSDSFVIDRNSTQAYFNIVKLGVMLVESVTGGENERNWLTDALVEYVNKFEDSSKALYITMDQIKTILGSDTSELPEVLMPLGLLMGNIEDADFKIKRVNLKEGFDAEGMYLFKIEETDETFDFYLAVDKMGKEGNAFQVICVSENDIVKADILFNKDETVSIQIPESIVSEKVIEFIANVYQIGTGAS